MWGYEISAAHNSDSKSIVDDSSSSAIFPPDALLFYPSLAKSPIWDVCLYFLTMQIQNKTCQQFQKFGENLHKT